MCGSLYNDADRSSGCCGGKYCTSTVWWVNVVIVTTEDYHYPCNHNEYTEYDSQADK